MSAQPSVLQVVILRDGLLVGTEVFVPGTYSVGSDPSSDLRLDDPSIDPRHAMLYFQNGRSAIQDAGSQQGVYVNGHRVTACEIRSVDEVLCGPFVLKTRVLSQKPAEKPPPSPEVAALLGGAPQPSAPQPQAAVRPLRPAPQATMPARPSAAVGPSVQAAPLSEVPAATVPTGYAPSAPRGPAPQAAVVPIAQPSVQSRGAAAASRGGPAVAHAQQPMPEPAVMAMPPPQAVPANTVPSARRRATQDVMPAQDAGPAIHLADELFGDLLPPEAPLPTEPEPLAVQEAPRQAPAPRPAPRQAPAPAVKAAPREAHAPAAEPRDPPRSDHAPKLGPGKGAAQLYLELYWGGVRREARRFSGGKQPLQAAADEKAGMPLWGFALPEEGFTLAEAINGAYRLYVPPGSVVEKANSGARYQQVQITALEADGTRRFITLRDGTSARLSQGQMSLVAYAAPKPEKTFVNPLSGMPWLALVCFFLFGGGFGAFIALKPQLPESPDFLQKNLPPVALRLLAPEPKKKEEAKKKLEAIKARAKPEKKAEKPPEKVVERPKPVERTPPPKKEEAPPPPESKALKALAKLSAAGPATNDVLAAVDKLGSGPGSKNVKTSNYKLSGLIGKAPIANAGLGTFGLGGGGKGGGATLGAELLRGKGGGGIGALGAGGVGKGQVGGVVTKATSHSISAPQGSIDREAVAKVINSHLQEVYGCYERALLKDTGLAGKVVLEWTIGGSGSVVTAKTKSSTLRNGSVEACILSSLKKWNFPAPKGGVVVISYPFIFNSVGY